MITACSSDSDSDTITTTETAETHTVILYFPWSGKLASSSGSLLSYIKGNISTIKSQILLNGGTGNARVVMLLASNATTATLSEIVYADTLCVEEVIAEYSDVDFTQTANIQELFNTIASYTPKSNQYSLLMGCHGSGWLSKDASPAKSRAFGGGESATKADISQLANALSNSAIGHVNYICFDDCYMANVETVYELKDVCDYVLASTSEVMDVGLPYAYVWQYLVQREPDYEAIISDFDYFYTNYRYPYGAFSCSATAAVESMASTMKSLNNALDEAGISPQDVDCQYLCGYSPHVFYDFQDYVNKALELLEEGGYDTTGIGPQSTDFETLTPWHSCTSYIYSTLHGEVRIKVDANCGLTISDPSKNSAVTSTIEDTAWYSATH